MNISKRSIKSGIFHICIIVGVVLFFGFFAIVEARHLKLYGPKRPEKGVTWVTYTNDFTPSSVVPSSIGDAATFYFMKLK
ncbi:MAG: hypothetical protein NG784_00525 [Candidatus Jettenia sp.]|nr:hypothetical protein [Candidatus Jettenia sp.]